MMSGSAGRATDKAAAAAASSSAERADAGAGAGERRRSGRPGSPPAPLRIGSRGSALALAQARHVARLLHEHGEADAEVIAITTSGDAGRRPGTANATADATAADTTAAAATDKSRWVDGIERALLDGEIDLAVHSAKDLPGELAGGLALLGCPARASAHDVLCGAERLEQLAGGARVGTSSLRRAAQLRAVRPDLEVVALAGNVDTRLAKLDAHADGIDAIVLAMAALQRLGCEQRGGAALQAQHGFVPSPGQGALALEGRETDARARSAAAAITDAQAFGSLLAERALARALEAGCDTPLGAHAQPAGAGDSELLLQAWVGLPDGSRWILDEQRGARDDPAGLGALLAQRMRAAGAGELLAAAAAAAGAMAR